MVRLQPSKITLSQNRVGTFRWGNIPLAVGETFGFIPGELSFAANSGELERTRANSGELRANSPAVRRHPHSGELRRTFAGVRRTFAGVRRSSLGFARVRAYSAANWRTVRQKIRSPEEISTSVRRERGPPRTWFAANDVRRELRSRRTTTLANSFAKNF